MHVYFKVVVIRMVRQMHSLQKFIFFAPVGKKYLPPLAVTSGSNSSDASAYCRAEQKYLLFALSYSNIFLVGILKCIFSFLLPIWGHTLASVCSADGTRSRPATLAVCCHSLLPLNLPFQHLNSPRRPSLVICLLASLVVFKFFAFLAKQRICSVDL